MRAAAEEVRRQRAEHAAAARLLGREAPEIAVDDERGLRAIEPAQLVALGAREQLGRHDLEGPSRGRRIEERAVHGRRISECQAICQAESSLQILLLYMSIVSSSTRS